MDRVEQRILDIIDQNKEKILAFGDDIWHHAELGYQEFRTSQKFCEQMDALGLKYEKNLAITGVKAYLKEKKDDEVCIALMGELDALPCPTHPAANPETGAAHTCGHNEQLTGIVGAAIALSDPEVSAALGGNIAFMAVPSEEATTAAEYKQKLMDEGKIKFTGGKCELIRIGAMDDIGLVVGNHVGGDGSGQWSVCNAKTHGILDKYITYTGIAAHPTYTFKSVDALSAARLAMTAVDMQREGMSHSIWFNTHLVHGFIHNGGSVSNILTDKVDMEYNIRGGSIRALKDLEYRVDRSLKAAAIATGAGMVVRTVPGYMPLSPLKNADVLMGVMKDLAPEGRTVNYIGPDDFFGATDYGDLSNVVPVMQFLTGGQCGVTHTEAFNITDVDEYYMIPVKCFALAAYRLLKNGAAEARKIIEENKPPMTKEEYLNGQDQFKRVDVVEMKPVPTELIPERFR